MNKYKLEDIIKHPECYDAHISENTEGIIIRRESLQEHTERVEKFFEKLWTEKDVFGMLERFCQSIVGNLSGEAKEFWIETVRGMLLFHDTGKLNPEFQNKKMKNSRTKNDKKLSRIVGSRHSVISAVLYLNHYLGKLNGAVSDKGERIFLKTLIMLHSYLIERHHSGLENVQDYFQKMKNEAGKDIVDVLSGQQEEILAGKFSLNEDKIHGIAKLCSEYTNNFTYEQKISLYIYEKVLFSLLVASDYYATSEFRAGVEITQFGEIDEIEKWITLYENTEQMQETRRYQREEYPREAKALEKEKDINVLRKEMFCEAEKRLKEQEEKSVFYLEAPTGSGKSNTAMNLTFQIIKANKKIRKVFYIYPFNTLVEQNMQSLGKVFGENEEIMKSIAVVNSLTPMSKIKKTKEQGEEAEDAGYYQRILLDRQFLNYPMILSTHVSLFDMMFGNTKESVFGLHQLMNSVIVLDEIQSYKNTLWTEIAYFFKAFSELLNIKVIIMSATLPNLDLLTTDIDPAARLLENREKYFLNECFSKRVRLYFELMECENIEEVLLEQIRAQVLKGKKVLVEFIRKDSAADFFKKAADYIGQICDVEYMSGDDSLAERERILNKIKKNTEGIILISTQVIEAGVDIDMDIGYKNISKLDSEEQFLGRINRSCLRIGEVYFFKKDDGKKIYREDIRIEPVFTLEEAENREILENKNFPQYYEKIFCVLRKNWNESQGDVGLQTFFEEVGNLNFTEVKKHMQLIEEETWGMQVYLARTLHTEDGQVIDGKKIWEEYVELLFDYEMDYAKKRVLLSEIRSKMNNFIYRIKKNGQLNYNDNIGDIFYIEDGENYFTNGKLDRAKIQGEQEDFIDFI